MTAKSPVQVTTQHNGKNITLSADSPEEMTQLTGELLKHADELMENLTTLDQIILAKSVMSTGVVGTAENTTTPTSSAPRSQPPPSGDTPECSEHGPVNDLAGKLSKAGKPYAKRYYCKKFGCETFKPQGEWVA